MRGVEIKHKKIHVPMRMMMLSTVLFLLLCSVPFTAVSSWIPEPGSPSPLHEIEHTGEYTVALPNPLPNEIPIHLKASTFDPLMEETQLSQEWLLDSGNDYYIIQCTGPILSQWALGIEAAGAAIVGYIPDYAYIAHMEEETRYSVEKLPFIRWVGHYHPGYKTSQSLSGLEGEVELNVLVFSDREGNIPLVKNKLKNLEGVITHIGQENNIIRVRIHANRIRDIAFIPEVEWIDLYMPPVKFMDNIRAFTGVNTVEVGGFNGTGIVGEVKDDGIDQTHPDLAPQIIGTEGNLVDDAHGTCTFGIVFSTGENNAQAKGMIPGGQGVFCDWQVDRGISVRHLVENWGGVFQTNSWGYAVYDGGYSMFSQENDNAVFTWDVTVIYSAGNSEYGVYSGSISQDSAAKNVICVGALWHKDNTVRGDDYWTSNGPGATPSQGPAADGRVKPDISGPFDAIFTTDSVDGDGEDGYSPENYTNNFGGTSGAAPVVAGCAGLVYQMYKENHFGNNPDGDIPHASTVKAVLIADAYQYDFAQAGRYQQGWGGVDVGNVYSIGQNHLIVDEPTPLQTGESTLYSIAPTGAGPLKISLVWTDPPATPGANPALVNDLHLKVTDPVGNVYWGNNGLLSSKWSSTGGSPDSLNNVENVFIENPSTDDWTIEVTAQNVASDGYIPTVYNDQIYSVVASNAIPKAAINITYPYYTEMIVDTVTVTGTAFEQAVSVELKVDNGMWQTVNGTTDWSYIWDTKTYTDGLHMLYARAYNGVAYSYEKQVPVYIDNTPPELTLAFQGPSYFANQTWYVMNSTQFLLNADDGVGSGVDGIWFSIDFEGIEVVPETQGNTFTLIWDEGNYTIHYYCLDNLGNVNGTVVLSAFADTSAPVTDIDVGYPRFRGSESHFWNVTIENIFSFPNIIEASCVDFTWYFIDDDFKKGSSFDLKDYVSGTHTISWGSQDVFGHNESGHSIVVTLDRNPPKTVDDFGQPRYRGSVSHFWNITDNTPFSLTSTDDYAGVDFTWYSIDDDVFLGTSFTLANYEDGLHTVAWGAVDNLGNNKTENSATLYLDSHSPTTILNIGEPKYRSSEDHLWNVTEHTTFILSAHDEYAGVAATWYVVNGVYREGNQFTLTGIPDRKCFIEWGSIDFLGQNETSNEITIFLDSSPPITGVSIEGPSFRHHMDSALNVTAWTLFNLTALDFYSGVAFTWYTIDNDYFEGSHFDMGDYAEGYYTITWGSEDNLENAESGNSQEIYLNTHFPATTMEVSEPKCREKPIHFWNVTSATRFILTPLIPHTGNSAVWYTIDGDYYEGDNFSLAGYSEGLHHITWGAEDNLGNNESGNLLPVYLDLDAPFTQLDIGAPKYRADSGDNWAVNAITLFSLSSQDNCSGMAFSWYSIDGLFLEGASFTLHGYDDGVYTIAWGSTDRLGNNETAQFITVLLDGTPPVVAIHAGSPHQVIDGVTHVTSETQLTLTLADHGVNNSIILYSLNGGTIYTLYTGPFTASFRSNSIKFYGKDILGNTGDELTLSIVINDNDYDSDGLKDLEDEDDDDDGLLDTQEDVNQNGIFEAGETDPLNPDSDGDGYSDLADAYPLDKSRWNGEENLQIILVIILVVIVAVVLLFALLLRRKTKDTASGVSWMDEEGPAEFKRKEETDFTIHDDDKTLQWHHEGEARFETHEEEGEPEWEGGEDTRRWPEGKETQFEPAQPETQSEPAEEDGHAGTVEDTEFEYEGDARFVPMKQEEEPQWKDEGDTQFEPEEDAQFEAAEQETFFEATEDEEHTQFGTVEEEKRSESPEDSEFKPVEDDVDFELEGETGFELHEYEEHTQLEDAEKTVPEKKERKVKWEEEEEADFEVEDE